MTKRVPRRKKPSSLSLEKKKEGAKKQNMLSPHAVHNIICFYMEVSSIISEGQDEVACTYVCMSYPHIF